MKNSAVKAMYAKQYNVELDDVNVEFLYTDSEGYVFRVMVFQENDEVSKLKCKVFSEEE